MNTQFNQLEPTGKTRACQPKDSHAHPQTGNENLNHTNVHLWAQELLVQDDHAFLLKNSEITEEILADLLENLKRTLE
jgi:hypothetical protein